jgi:hypothetical protein
MSEDERQSDVGSSGGEEDEDGPQPWAKTSASTESLAADDEEDED